MWSVRDCDTHAVLEHTDGRRVYYDLIGRAYTAAEALNMSEQKQATATQQSLSVLQQSLEGKTLTLQAAAVQFRYYEAQHRAKGTAEGEAKAEVNAKFAQLCDDAAAL